MIRLDAVSISVTLADGPAGALAPEAKALPLGATAAPDLATAEAAFAAGLSESAEQAAAPLPPQAMQVIADPTVARRSLDTATTLPPVLAVARPETGDAGDSVLPEATPQEVADAAPRPLAKLAAPPDRPPERTDAPIDVSVWALSAMALPVEAAVPRFFAEPAGNADPQVGPATTAPLPKPAITEALVSGVSPGAEWASSVVATSPRAPGHAGAPARSSAIAQGAAEESTRATADLPDQTHSALPEPAPDRSLTAPATAGGPIARSTPDLQSPLVATSAAPAKPAPDTMPTPAPLKVGENTAPPHPAPVTLSGQDDALPAAMEVQIVPRRSTPGPRPLPLPEQQAVAGLPATPAEPETSNAETPEVKATPSVSLLPSAIRIPGQAAAAIVEPSSHPPPEPADEVRARAATDSLQKAPMPLLAPGTLPRREKADQSGPVEQIAQPAGAMPLPDTSLPQATPSSVPSHAVTSAPDLSRIITKGSGAVPLPTDGTGAGTELPLTRQLGRGLVQANPSCELALAPAELGRVKLTLEGPAEALILRISAERPETLALLRRHIDQLTREFRDLGYPSLTVSFTREGSLTASLVNAVLAGQDTGQSAGQNPGAGAQGNQQPPPPVATGAAGDMQSGARWLGGGNDPGGQTGGQSQQRQPPMTIFEPLDPVPSAQLPSAIAAKGLGGLDLRL